MWAGAAVFAGLVALAGFAAFGADAFALLAGLAAGFATDFAAAFAGLAALVGFFADLAAALAGFDFAAFAGTGDFFEAFLAERAAIRFDDAMGNPGI